MEQDRLRPHSAADFLARSRICGPPRKREVEVIVQPGPGPDTPDYRLTQAIWKVARKLEREGIRLTWAKLEFKNDEHSGQVRVRYDAEPMEEDDA